MMTTLRLFAALLIITGGLVGAAPPSSFSGVRVTILLFSGRDDPQFVLTDPAEIRTVLSLVRELPGESGRRGGSSTGRPMFGFRGIIVENRSTTFPEIFSFRVYNDQVETVERSADGRQSVRTSRVDAGRLLQTHLLAKAREKRAIPNR